MLPKFLIEKEPEGLLSVVEGNLPLDISPSNGPGVYKVHALSDSNTEVSVTTTTAPVVQTAAMISGSGVVGSVVGVQPGQWLDATSVTGQWLADGVPIDGATGLSLTLSDAQDGADLSYRETAQNAVGSTVQDSAALLVYYDAPALTGTLYDEIFDHATGYGEVPTAQVFSGAGLRYAALGGNALINAATGLVQIPTDIEQEGAVVTVTASNSGGEASAAFQVTVEQDPTVISEVTEIQADGVVFRFDRSVEAGMFANGDWFVIANGASLAEALPAAEQVSTQGYAAGVGAMDPTTGQTRWINGLEIGMSFLETQGFDSYRASAGARSYDAAQNWDPGATGQVLGLAAGQQIVKAVSVAQDPTTYSGAVSDLKNPVSKLVTLTVVASAPPAGAFRPPLRGWDGVTFYTEDMVDWSRLPQQDVSALMPVGDPDDMASPFPFWLDGSLGAKAAGATAVDQTHGTAAKLGEQVGLNLMWLCGQVPLSEKIPHGIDMIQAGLDGLLTRAERPRGYAGQGLVAAGAFAAHMLDRPELTALAAATPSWPGDLDTLGQEQHQVFALPGSAVDTPIEVNLTDPTAVYGQSYQIQQQGIPEWEAFDPANTPAFPTLEPVYDPQSGPAFVYGPSPDFVGPTSGDFFVATDGDDGNAGTSVAAPFATVQAAIDAANAAGGTQSIVLRGGKYRQKMTLAGVTADLTFAAYGTEAVTLTAAEALTGWSVCTSGDQSEVGVNFANIYKATIPLAGLEHGALHLLNLYENDARCNIAMDRMTDIDSVAHAWRDDTSFHVGTFNTNASSEILSITDAAVLSKYTSTQAADLAVCFYNGDNRATLTAFSAFDATTGTGTLANQSKKEHSAGASTHRYSRVNSTHAIKQGRWAARDNGDGTGTVYFWPNDPAHLAAGIEYSTRDHIVDLADTQGNVTFNGVNMVRAAGDGIGPGMCIGSITVPSDIKPGRVTLTNCTIGESGGDNYGAVHPSNFAGGFSMTHVKVHETNGLGLYTKNCPDTWITKCLHHKHGDNAIRCFEGVGWIWSHSMVEEVARNTHSNVASIYEHTHEALIWGVKARDVFGYLTCSQASSFAMGFSDLEVNNVPSDDRAFANQNRPAGVGLVGKDGGASPDGSGTLVAGTRMYMVNNAFRPDSADEQANSFSMGNGPIGSSAENWTQRNNLYHGMSDAQQATDDRAGNVFSGLGSDQRAKLPVAGEAFQLASEMYVDPFGKDYSPRAGSILRGRVGEDISDIIATLQAMHPAFTAFDQDMNGTLFDATMPPVGPEVVLPEAPAEPVYPYAPVALAADAWLRLGDHQGWDVSETFITAISFTLTDNSARTWLVTNGLNTYLAFNTNGTMRVRFRQEDGTELFVDTGLTPALAYNQSHSAIICATDTACQVWVNGTLLVNVARSTVAPMRVPTHLNATADAGDNANAVEIDAVWSAVIGVDAVTAAAALFDPVTFEPTPLMRAGGVVGGVTPGFFEARSAAWPTRAGWLGPQTATSFYLGAEIGRADRMLALKGLVPTALALHMMPPLWSVAGSVPLRHYLDRVMSWFAQHYDTGGADFTDATQWGSNLETAVSAAQYTFYRDVIRPQITLWSGVPEVPLPPQVTHDGNSDLVVTLADFAADNNSPLLQRNMRYRVQGASQWTVVADVGNQALIPNVGSGDSYEVQIQHVNAQGASGWSYNTPLMGGPSAGPLRAAGAA